ncbi:MAG: type II toxin-antitoxin system Phd/YefM family antitoxin [Micrococcales bacterium]|nr:type II toxin-antitoxin system Phd/YefM family antitoxin [Micrococcales bacterium]
MKAVSVAEARRSLASVLDEVPRGPVVIERRGKAVAVMMEAHEFERLRAAQDDLDDIAAFDAAMAEEGQNLPWEQAKADLGWT